MLLFELIQEKEKLLTIKSEHVLVITLALGFVSYLFTQQITGRPGPVILLEALSGVVTGGGKGQKPNKYPVCLM